MISLRIVHKDSLQVAKEIAEYGFVQLAAELDEDFLDPGDIEDLSKELDLDIHEVVDIAEECD
eukprot:10771412-Prorocentrum_lima.AAC.1